MTSITLKQLANDQLPSTAGTLYVSPTATTTLIKGITLVNTNTTAESINLYILKSGGTSRKIIPVNLQLPAGWLLIYDTPISLEAADKIMGDSTTANKVDFTISGVQDA